MRTLIARYMGQHVAHLGPVGPGWTQCRPYESCFLGAFGCIIAGTHCIASSNLNPVIGTCLAISPCPHAQMIHSRNKPLPVLRQRWPADGKSKRMRTFHHIWRSSQMSFRGFRRSNNSTHVEVSFGSEIRWRLRNDDADTSNSWHKIHCRYITMDTPSTNLWLHLHGLFSLKKDP